VIVYLVYCVCIQCLLLQDYFPLDVIKCGLAKYKREYVENYWR